MLLPLCKCAVSFVAMAITVTVIVTLNVSVGAADSKKTTKHDPSTNRCQN